MVPTTTEEKTAGVLRRMKWVLVLRAPLPESVKCALKDRFGSKAEWASLGTRRSRISIPSWDWIFPRRESKLYQYYFQAWEEELIRHVTDAFWGLRGVRVRLGLLGLVWLKLKQWLAGFVEAYGRLLYDGDDRKDLTGGQIALMAAAFLATWFGVFPWFFPDLGFLGKMVCFPFLASPIYWGALILFFLIPPPILVLVSVFRGFSALLRPTLFRGLWAREIRAALPAASDWVQAFFDMGMLKTDDLQRPHCTTGPCLELRGVKFFFLHGVSVPERAVTNPWELTAEEIRRMRNTEVRRVLAERLGGFGKLLSKAGARVVDADCSEQNWTRALLEFEGERYLNVSDPSTKRVYLLRVHPEVRTCEEADAWLWGAPAGSTQRDFVQVARR